MGDGIANKIKIVRALVKLMESRTLDDISVAEICEVAGISRQTFYRSFEDKYAIANWYSDSVIESTTRQIGRTLGWRDGYLTLAKILGRNAAFMRGVSKSRELNSIFARTIRMSAADMTQAYATRKGHEPEGRVAYQIHAFARTSTECMSEWFEGGCVLDPETFVDYVVSLVPRELFDALEMESLPEQGDAGLLLLI